MLSVIIIHNLEYFKTSERVVLGKLYVVLMDTGCVLNLCVFCIIYEYNIY
jgi:hypothetical protein